MPDAWRCMWATYEASHVRGDVYARLVVVRLRQGEGVEKGVCAYCVLVGE